jgi:hypothetical protein
MLYICIFSNKFDLKQTIRVLHIINHSGDNSSLFCLSGKFREKKFNTVDTNVAKIKMHAMMKVTQSSSISIMALPCLTFG